jgi:putative ABC transport system permease protein
MGGGLYRVFSSIALAFRAVRRNKLRAALTTLGITIGVAAVVTVMALATAARANVTQQVAALGSNALIVFPKSTRSSGARLEASSKLSELDVKALTRESTSIRLAAPFLRATAVAIYEGESSAPSVIGTRLDYFEVRNWKTVAGTTWTQTQESTSEKVLVIGKTTARELFGTLDPIGRTIRVGRFNFEVIGLLEEKGQSPFGQDQDAILLMPISTMRSTIVRTRPNEVQAILMSATSAETTGRALKQAEEILRAQHKIREGQEDDFAVRSQAEFQALQDTIFGFLTLLLVGIAAVSLVVGGIGVMNIMLVSVAERTREIGIRMAIGAREADIMVQFLVEALVLAFLGGALGTALGYAAIFGFRQALDWTITISTEALLLALGTSTTIGLVFGFMPARRAARMDPVQALGRE